MTVETQNKKNSLIPEARKDFPLLSRSMNGKPLIYLDNAATTQKPIQVIDRIQKFYQEECATVHRGVYALSQDSTIECERVREKVRTFINAHSTDEIIFVRGATEAINLVASSYGRKFCRPGDEIVITQMEHHANFVPWQILAQDRSIKLNVVNIKDDGQLDWQDYMDKLSPRTKLVAVTHISNVLGTINPVKKITEAAHEMGAHVLVDAAQSAPHEKIDVIDIGCDFLCFSGHKIYGPTGVGVLYGRASLLEEMSPYQFGGDMIELVTIDKTTFAGLPNKFEAGTPPIAQIIGLGAALDYLQKFSWADIANHENALMQLATKELNGISGLKIIGTADQKASLISFTLENIHPHDIGTILDMDGIAIRAGHHCAQPTMQRFKVPATTRASFSFYNTLDDVSSLVSSIKKAIQVMR